MMRRLTTPAFVLLSTLGGLALASPMPGHAQQATQERVPFKATLQGPWPETLAVIPGNPALAVHIQKFTGTADFMGAVSHIDLHPVNVTDDGKPIGQPFGQGAIMAANGDAIYYTWSGAAWPTETGGQCLHTMIITGGKGRFKGVTGSGLLRGEGNVTTQKVTLQIEATITPPLTQ